MNSYIVLYVDHRGLLTCITVTGHDFQDAFETFKMIAHKEIISISKSPFKAE
jgi:hypothetical protein